MEVDAGLFLFFALFQFGGATLLAFQRIDGRRGPPMVLAALLVVNGALTAISFLASVGLPLGTADDVYLAIDSTTGALLLAYAALRHGKDRAGMAALGLALVSPIAGLALPSLLLHGVGGGILVTMVYYAGLSVVLVTSARGAAIDHWICAAFAPRALLFATQAAHSLVVARGAMIPFDLAMQCAAVVLGLAPLWALVRIARGPVPGGPTLPVVITLALIGPADAIAWKFVDGSTPRGALASSVLNYLTLSLVRPLFLYVAFVPSEVPRLLARSLFAAGLGAAFVATGPSIGFPPPTVGILALSIGSLVLAVDEARRNRVVGIRSGPSRGAQPATRGRPQWQTLLLALRGAGAVDGAPPRETWTQQGLARATGISVQRVSEFGESVNATAEQKLDVYLPSWRGDGVRAASTLVTRHTGLVAGLDAPRVYYRLTPLGMQLAEAVAATTIEPTASYKR